jgi:hypothetical protein
MTKSALTSESLVLTQNELVDLTNKHVRSAQSRTLNCLGIEHRFRPDGTIVVLRMHVVEALGGNVANIVQTKNIEPNWDSLR